MNDLEASELPQGLRMSLGMNPKAMKRFLSFSDTEKKQVISRAGTISTKQDMQAFVASLAENKADLGG